MKNHSKANGLKFFLLLAGLTLGLAASADSAPQARSGTDGAQTVSASVKRDPFWPVGFVPEQIRDAELTDAQRALKSTTGNEDWNAAMKQVAINGVSSRADNEFFAVINGQIKSVGDTIMVVYGGARYTWMVDSIKPPGSVKLRRMSVR